VITLIRTILYGSAKYLGDLSAILKGRVIVRIFRRIAGKITGRGLGWFFRKFWNTHYYSSYYSKLYYLAKTLNRSVLKCWMNETTLWLLILMEFIISLLIIKHNPSLRWKGLLMIMRDTIR